MEVLIEMILEAIVWSIAHAWPRVAVFVIIIALIIGAFVVFGK